MRRDQEKWDKVIGYHKDGYLNSQIARMMGVKRQRISVMVNTYKAENPENVVRRTKLTNFQVRKINQVVYPKIRDHLLKENLPLGDFCKKVGSTDNPYLAMSRFLMGETDKTSIGSVYNILKEIGIPFEETFSRDAKNE